MSSFAEFIHGEGRLDAVVRALLLAAVLAVSGALVWTTLSLIGRPAPAIALAATNPVVSELPTTL